MRLPRTSSSPALPVTALVVPHTHWDRAWYWPFERFRVRLIECLSTVLDLLKKHPEFRFSLDGQVLALEDYLEARPQDRPRAEKFIRQGRLVIGPFYCQPDLYCTGGEALIRNLLIGTHRAEGSGGVQKMVYMADTFGIIPEMPMIVRGFGMSVFCFMRGLAGEVPGMNDMRAIAGIPRQIPKGTRMFRWLGPDGSAVRVFQLRDGYANAADLGLVPTADGNHLLRDFDMATAITTLIERTEKQNDAQGKPLLLLAGVDHQIPQPQLPEILRRANQRGKFHFKISSFDDLMKSVAVREASKWPEVQGEFHGSGNASVLGGTLSARCYLKQTNATVERLLVHQAEAAHAFAGLLGVESIGAAALQTAWRQLLKCHPHDDICGCSVDAVHADNEYHFRQAAISATAITRHVIRQIAEVFGGNPPGDDRYCQWVVNTQPFHVRKRIRMKFDFEGRKNWGDYRPSRAIRLVTEDGSELPYFEVARGQSLEHPHAMLVVEALADLPPGSVRRIYLEDVKETLPRKKRTCLENEHLRVKIHANGSCTILDKKTGRSHNALGLFSGQADIGDTYDFADIPDEKEQVFSVVVFHPQAPPLARGMQVASLRGKIPIPASATAENRSRKTVQQTFEVQYSLAPGERQLELRIRTRNLACDHRVRWNLPLATVPRNVRAGLKFSEVARVCGDAPTGKKAPRIHPEHPFDAFVAVEDENRGGLAVFSEYPMSYEVVKGRGPRLAITLYRSVAWLSNPQELTTRPGVGTGPGTPTPAAQLLGRVLDFRLALRPFSKKEAPALMREALLWRWQPVIGQSEVWYPRRKKEFPAGPFIEMQGAAIVSAFKKSQDGKNVVLRLHNPTARAIVCKLRVRDLTQLREVGLHEKPLPQAPWRSGRDGAFALAFAPWSLRTFRLETLTG